MPFNQLPLNGHGHVKPLPHSSMTCVLQQNLLSHQFHALNRNPPAGYTHLFWVKQTCLPITACYMTSSVAYLPENSVA